MAILKFHLNVIEAISHIMTRCDGSPPALDIVLQSQCLGISQSMKSILGPLDQAADWVTSLELNGFNLHFAEGTGSWDPIMVFPSLKSLVLGYVNFRQRVYISPRPKLKISVSHLSLRGPLWDEHNICCFLADHPMPLPSPTPLDV